MSFLGTRWKCIWSTGAARQRRALQALSDHVLKDIGLSRSDIDGISASLAYRRADSRRRSRRR
jgi:hypothetical protein